MRAEAAYIQMPGQPMHPRQNHHGSWPTDDRERIRLMDVWQEWNRVQIALGKCKLRALGRCEIKPSDKVEGFDSPIEYVVVPHNCWLPKALACLKAFA